MLEELRFRQQSKSEAKPEVELLTVSEEDDRVVLCMHSESPTFERVFRLSRKDEAELLSYLMKRLFVADPPRRHHHIGTASPAASELQHTSA
jgi:hypothetical protein